MKKSKTEKIKPPIMIAEIGCNHKGDFNIAKDMIKMAKEFCQVDFVKFQKRNNKELLSEAEYNAPHPNPDNSYGKTYGEHREFLEFTLDQHKKLKKYCDRLGVGYASSVWDVTSAKQIVSLKPSYIKIPSPCNLNKDLLDYLIKNYKGEIHMSVGMTDKKEQEAVISYFEKHGRNKDLVIYSCTSGYPVPMEDVCLLEILRLKEEFANRVKSIGFSGHHEGIAVDVAATTLGVSHIERHFTLNRAWKGTDHAASLEPDGLRRVCRDVRSVCLALRYKGQDILDIEKEQRKKLKNKVSL